MADRYQVRIVARRTKEEQLLTALFVWGSQSVYELAWRLGWSVAETVPLVSFHAFAIDRVEQRIGGPLFRLNFHGRYRLRPLLVLRHQELADEIREAQGPI